MVEPSLKNSVLECPVIWSHQKWIRRTHLFLSPLAALAPSHPQLKCRSSLHLDTSWWNGGGGVIALGEGALRGRWYFCLLISDRIEKSPCNMLCTDSTNPAHVEAIWSFLIYHNQEPLRATVPWTEGTGIWNSLVLLLKDDGVGKERNLFPLPIWILTGAL